MRNVIADKKTQTEISSKNAESAVEGALFGPGYNAGTETTTEPPVEVKSDAETEQKPGVEEDQRSSIQKKCDKIAADANEKIDSAAMLVVDQIKFLRRELDNIETMMLQGSADAKAQIANQMTMVAKVAETAKHVNAQLPALRALAREIVDRGEK